VVQALTEALYRLDPADGANDRTCRRTVHCSGGSREDGVANSAHHLQYKHQQTLKHINAGQINAESFPVGYCVGNLSS